MGKMKRIIAASIVYIMAMMLIPVNTIIAKASEGEIPQFLEVSDLYVNSIAQYEDKSLISYTTNIDESNTGDKKKVTLSLFTNGTEKVLQEHTYTFIDQSISYQIYNISSTKSLIQLYDLDYSREPNILELTFYEYDFTTESFYEVTQEYFESYILTKGSDTTVRDENILKNIINKVNDKFNLEFEYNQEGLNVNATYLNGKTEDGGISYSVDGYINDQYINYYGVYGSNFDIISDKYLSQQNNISEKTTIFTEVIEADYEADKYKTNVYIIKEGNLILSGEIEKTGYISAWDISFYKDKGIIQNYSNNSMDIYDIIDGKFIFKVSIPKTDLTSIPKDKNGDLWTMLDEDGKRYIAKVENYNVIKMYEVFNFNDSTQLYVYDENNIVVSSPNGTIFINNGNNESDEDLLPELFKGIVNTELFNDLYADETMLSLTVKEEVDAVKFQEQLDVFQNLNPQSINMKGGAGTTVFRFTININGQVITVSLTNSNENVASMIVDFFNKNKEEQPPVVIPPVIENFIGSVVEVTEGEGTEEAPLVMDIKSVTTEELTEFLDNLEVLEPTVSKVEVEGDYTIFYIKVLRNTVARSVEEVYIKLVVKNDDTELLETLQKFEEEHKEVIQPEVPEEEDKEEVNPEVPEEEDDKEDSVVVTPDENDGKDETENTKPETDKDNAEKLPQTGTVVSTGVISAMAIVLVVAGLVMSRKGSKRLS